MKIAITLPQFRADIEPALTAARVADELGLDGAFVFDHVHAIGRPDRPALSAWPLLGALATETRRIAIGSLVARVSLLPNAVLAHNFESLHRMVGDRLIAGLGTGDKLSEAENAAVDVPFPSVTERLADLVDVCRRTRGMGITTWVGGLSSRLRRVAREEADALNLWGVDPDRIALERGQRAMTWGGAVPDTEDATADLLRALAEAGATWAVCSPPYRDEPDPRPAVEMLARAASHLR